jgi:peptide/nickel transport system permease protein
MSSALPAIPLTAPAESPRPTYLQRVVRDTLRPLMARLGLAWVGILAVLAVLAPFLANSYPILLKTGGQWSSPLYHSLAPADFVLPVAAVTALVAWWRRLRLGVATALVLWTVCLTFAAAARGSIVTHGGYLETLTDWFGKPAAITLLLAMGAALAAYIVWAPLRVLPAKATAWTAALLAPLLLLLLLVPVRPVLAPVYERYREMEAAGQVQFILRAPLPYSANDRLRDRPEFRRVAPNWAHPMGTDPNGADVLSRMIHACRIALSIGFIATGIAVVVGVIIGGLMGYFVGWVDLLGMRLIEILEAIPRLVLLVAITASYGRSLYLMMVVIGLLSWTGDARFLRAEFLRLRAQDFVQAARALGLPLHSILFRHMLPNGIAPVLVSASFGVASAILLESTLSFLGLGLVDEPSWGQMLNQAREGAGFIWWLAWFPGAAIFLTVFAYNLVGESLRDALDPRLRASE